MQIPYAEYEVESFAFAASQVVCNVTSDHIITPVALNMLARLDNGLAQALPRKHKRKNGMWYVCGLVLDSQEE